MSKKLSEAQSWMLEDAYKQERAFPKGRGFGIVSPAYMPEDRYDPDNVAGHPNTAKALVKHGYFEHYNPDVYGSSQIYRLTPAGREAARTLLADGDGMELDAVKTKSPISDEDWQRYETILAADSQDEPAQPDTLDTRGLRVRVFVGSGDVQVHLSFTGNLFTQSVSLRWLRSFPDVWNRPVVRYPQALSDTEIRSLANALQVAADIAKRGAEWVIEHEAELTDSVIDCAAKTPEYEEPVDPPITIEALKSAYVECGGSPLYVVGDMITFLEQVDTRLQTLENVDTQPLKELRERQQRIAELEAERDKLVKITEYYRRGVKVIYDLSHDEVTADRAHHILENEPK